MSEMLPPCSIAFEELLDSVENQLTPDRAAALQAHLNLGCVLCERRLAEIHTLLTSLRPALSGESTGELPGAKARRFARRLGAFRSPRTTPGISRTIARLVVRSKDQNAMGATIGIRAGAPMRAAQGSHSVYETDQHLIFLREEKADLSADGSFLIGEIYLKENGTRCPAEAVLWTNMTTGETISASLVAAGEFYADHLTTGKYLVSCLLAQIGHSDTISPEPSDKEEEIILREVAVGDAEAVGA